MKNLLLHGNTCNVTDVINWCANTFGNSAWNVYIADFSANTWTFTFEDEQSALLCKLKWS